MSKPAFPLCALFAAVLLAAPLAPRAEAQAPLFLADEKTTIRRIDFRFSDTQTFEGDVLRQQIVTGAPGFADRLKRFLPFTTPNVYLLDRIELQKDVVRLRRFYRRNGFTRPWVDYGESRLDTTRNAIRILFTVTEGPPLIIQDVNFYAPNGRFATTLFTGRTRDRWIRFRDRTSFKTGDRFTTFDLVRIQDQVLEWLKDSGYAFARFDSTRVDSTGAAADIGFYINPGPIGYFSDILIEGNESISKRAILRELPFRQGDRFSYNKLIEGQRQLFSLNLFRVALADVLPVQQDTTAPLQPDYQWRDSTVTVRFRVREARLRYLTAQTGYSADLGLTLQGRWSHRNFFGQARNLTVNSLLHTGVLATSLSSGTDPPLLLRGSVALRQPYVFTSRLSAVVEPFAQLERDPLLPRGIGALRVNRREFGVSTVLIYELLPFRTASLRYALSQALQPTIQLTDTTRRDVFGKSILTLNGTFGKVNNFLNPRRGFLVRPFAEHAGGLGGLVTPGVEYVKLGFDEIVGYIPLTSTVSVGVRLAGGRLWPSGNSRNQFDVPFENRFDPIRFYAGGPSDVRGWDLGLVGPKFNRTRFVRDEDGTILTDPKTGLPLTENAQYEAVGGLAKMAGNIEVRLPFPGLNNAWRTAVFLDFGQVSAEATVTPGCLSEDTQCGFRDDGTLALSKLKFGAGAGIRYETPVGYIRLDLAFKINPDDLDLQSPRSAFLFAADWTNKPPDFGPDKDFWKRFNLHLSLGQAF